MSLADPAAAGLPPTDAEHLPDDVATLKRMVLELLASLRERDRNIEGLRHHIHLLLHRLYGPRGERFDPDQLLLFAEMATGVEKLACCQPEVVSAVKVTVARRAPVWLHKWPTWAPVLAALL